MFHFITTLQSASAFGHASKKGEDPTLMSLLLHALV